MLVLFVEVTDTLGDIRCEYIDEDDGERPHGETRMVNALQLKIQRLIAARLSTHGMCLLGAAIQSYIPTLDTPTNRTWLLFLSLPLFCLDIASLSAK